MPKWLNISYIFVHRLYRSTTRGWRALLDWKRSFRHAAVARCGSDALQRHTVSMQSYCSIEWRAVTEAIELQTWRVTVLLTGYVAFMAAAESMDFDDHLPYYTPRSVRLLCYNIQSAAKKVILWNFRRFFGNGLEISSCLKFYTLNFTIIYCILSEWLWFRTATS